MTSLIKKNKGGKQYYYLVQSGRVNGKPRVIWQKYLGTLDNLIRLTSKSVAPQPSGADVREFGALAALLTIARDLDIEGMIDGIVSKRKQGASIGRYLLLAALNRATSPNSKCAMPEWYDSTVLRRIWGLPSKTFSSQNFWEAMHKVTPEHLAIIENRLVDRVMKLEGLKADAIIYDTTNFSTYISSVNELNTIAQRGHAKDKRYDLRLVGLALLVTRDHGIPLFHEPYAGNICDSKQIQNVVLSLIERYENFGDRKNVTLVFDKGNQSQDLFDILDGFGIHYVTSTRMYLLPDLLDIGEEAFKPLAGYDFADEVVFRTQRKMADGSEKTILVVKSHSRAARDMSNMSDALRLAMDKLDFEASKLRKWRAKPTSKKPTVHSLKLYVEKITKSEKLGSFLRVNAKMQPFERAQCLIEVKIDEDEAGIPILQYKLNTDAIQSQIIKTCGKSILITTRSEWSDADIVKTYRDQFIVEDDFRSLKDTGNFGWNPMFHWTDDNIRVHAFYCVLALLLTRIAKRRCHLKDMNISQAEMLSQLSAVKEVDVIYTPEGQKTPAQIQTTYTRSNPIQRQLAGILDLAVWQSA